jgi:hypothetical protein
METEKEHEVPGGSLAGIADKFTFVFDGFLHLRFLIF